MSGLELSLACGLYDRTVPFFDGSLQPEGITLHPQAFHPGELFRRQARDAEFDVAEFSLATLAILHAQGDRRFVALPVYPARRFRHQHVWVSTRAGISSPADLKGKRVGVQEFVQTASVWIRGFLQDDFGVSSRDVEWCVGGYNAPDPAYSHRIPLALADAGIAVTQIPSDDSLDAMLRRGELAALLPGVPASFREGSPEVARLFPCYWEVEADYFARTGIFPIMHVVVVKRELYERDPWIAESLVAAFVEAKRISDERYELSPGPLYASLPWLDHHFEETRALLGHDFWSYGYPGNEHVIATLLRHLHDQALVEVPIDDPRVLFAPETLHA